MGSTVAGTQRILMRSTNLGYSSSYLGSQGHKNINLVMRNEEEPSFPVCSLTKVLHFLGWERNAIIRDVYTRVDKRCSIKKLISKFFKFAFGWISEGHKIIRKGPSLPQAHLEERGNLQARYLGGLQVTSKCNKNGETLLFPYAKHGIQRISNK